MYKTYVDRLELLSDAEDTGFVMNLKQTCFNGVYPYKIFPDKNLFELELAPITIFYGGNGSGKTTLLNILAEKARVKRSTAFNGSPFFEGYVSECKLYGKKIPINSQIITSDDVFDYVLNIRNLNDGIDMRRSELFRDFLDRKYSSHRLSSLAEYDDWKESYEAKTKTQSQYVRDRLAKNTDMFSNGESAMRYFTERITDNALYLLDEPENSLSIELQQDLCEYISASASHYGCQFIMATHSPILLSMKNALIYDLDEYPVTTKKWTELENVRKYFEFFEMHRDAFLD